MIKKSFTVTLGEGEAGFALMIPFDVRAAFGRARPPVKVTINGHTYRSTVANMGSGPFIPLRKSNREAAGVTSGDAIEVTLELDTELREVIAPPDLEAALKAAGAWEKFREASFTHQREYVEAIEGAKRSETREKRIALAVAYAVGRKPKS